MPKVSTLNYNYRVTKHIKVNDNYEKVYDKLFSQLKDIIADFPDLTLIDIRYLARHNSIVRTNSKYKGLTIQKIFPVRIV